MDAPELAAVLSIMNINHTIKNKNEEKQIRTMFIIAGALISSIVNTNKYTVDEAVNKAVENLNEFRRIVDDMKKE